MNDVRHITRPVFFLIRLGSYFLLPPCRPFRLKTEEFCKKELLREPKDTSSMWFLGNLYVWYKEYGLAREPLESLLEQRENHRGTRLLLSKVYFNLDDFEGVKRLLAAPGLLSERDTENYYLGCSLLYSGEYRESTEFLSRYVAHHRNRYEAFMTLGYAHFMARAYAEALASYTKAEKLNPSSLEIKDAIALCREKLKA